jgi:choline dehydrogenase-like flavoprotein
MNKQLWDFIIIGSGVGGASLARDFARENKKVLVLEKGHSDVTINIPKMLYQKEMMFIGEGKTMVRGLRHGGTSVLYYGTSSDTPVDKFLPYGIDLTNELKVVKSELPIATLSDDLVGPVANKVMNSALELGYSWGKVDKFLRQELCSSDHFPFEALWTPLDHLEEAIQFGANLVSGADVKKILVEGKKAVGVEYIHQGKPVNAYGSKIIICAGGLGTPIILQNSGISVAGDGFFCDPVVIVHGTLPGINAGKEIPMAAGYHFTDEGYLLTDLTLPKLVYHLFSAQALRIDKLFSYHQSMSIMVKATDSIGGTISSNGKIRKTFTKEDKHKMNLGIERAKKILHHAGAKQIYHTQWTSAHPGGSVRIGELVDSNLETDYKNLFACDCSVIPFPWGLPPTLTILTLARRLSKHLLN